MLGQYNLYIFLEEQSQQAFTCSMLTIEALEQGVKSFKVNNRVTNKDASISDSSKL